jgi:OHCU decarboxylase
MPRVRALDALSPEDAATVLRACCGAPHWVSAMVAERPFETLDTLLAVAEEIWWALGPDDWMEAFAHHPRIGEQRGAVAQNAQGAAWSAGEQAGVADAASSVQAQLAEVNREYEARFGHIYIVCATGKSAEEMLALARQRLANDPDVELRVAAEEQRKITRLRLQKLFAGEAEP